MKKGFPWNGYGTLYARASNLGLVKKGPWKKLKTRPQIPRWLTYLSPCVCSCVFHHRSQIFLLKRKSSSDFAQNPRGLLHATMPSSPPLCSVHCSMMASCFSSPSSESLHLRFPLSGKIQCLGGFSHLLHKAFPLNPIWNFNPSPSPNSPFHFSWFFFSLVLTTV